MAALPSSILDAVLNTTSSALLTVSGRGELTWRNQAAQELSRTLGQELTTLSLDAAVPDGPPVQLRCPTAQGRVRHLRVTCRRLSTVAEGAPADLADLLYELVDETEHEADRSRAENYAWRLAHIERLSKVGTWEWHVRTDEVIWSPTLLAMFDLPADTKLDYVRYRAMLYPDDVPMIEATLQEALRTTEPFTYTHRMYTGPNRQLRVFECYGEVFTDSAGSPVRVLGTAHDVTEIYRVQHELAYLADHDPLTGLPNRRALTAQVDDLRAGSPMRDAALLLIDVDNFKDVNDVRGHATGDEVLCLLARMLPRHLPADAVVGRLGGDEFAVLLPDCTADRAVRVASGLCDVVARTPLAVRGEPLRVTLSIGAAPLATEQADDLLFAHADLALYQAKADGRNRARLYAPERHRQATQRADVVSRVRRALESGQLHLAAQPVVDLADDRTDSYELLVRLRDGRDPQLLPGDFLPELERGDLVCDLDRWVVETAVAALAKARAAGLELRMDVNISSRSLAATGFGDWVLSQLAQAAVPAAQLSLEITETAVISNLDAAQRLAATLTTAGCGFNLDDFGAGYGSFVYLRHLPFSAVKIAGELVRYADHNGPEQILIDAVVRAAHGLGMRTVAEHIDRPELVRVLSRLGVDRGQGFQLGRPEQLNELLARLTALGTPASAPQRACTSAASLR